MAEIPHSRLKLVFYVHFILVVLATVGWWTPTSYLFYNLILAFALLWGLFDTNATEPIQHAILINGAAVIFDIITLSIRYPDSHSVGDRFSAAMAILNLVVRPFSTILLHRVLQDRHGNLGPLEGVGNIFGGQQSAYQDMDKGDTLPTTSQQQQPEYRDKDFFAPAQQL